MKKKIVIALMSMMALFRARAMNSEMIQISLLQQTHIAELRAQCSFVEVKPLIERILQVGQSNDSLLQAISSARIALRKSSAIARNFSRDESEDALVRNELRRERSALEREFVKACVTVRARLESLRSKDGVANLLQYLDQTNYSQ